MNGRERALAMMSGLPVDRLPLMPITMMYASDTAGVRYGAYARDYRVLAAAQLKTAERFGFDYVSAISDPAREASDLGSAVEWFDDQPPAIIEERALLADKSKLRELPAPEQMLGARMTDRLEAIRTMREAVGDSLLVEGWVEGPCALAADLRGLNRLMIDFHDDPEFVRELFDYVVRMEIEFAGKQVAAGADLIGIGDAAASLIGPRMYEPFVFPEECRLMAGIHAAGGKVRLHICGNTRRILGGMGRTGADLVDLDYPSPMEEARMAMGERPALAGNLDPVRALRDGNEESVWAALEHCRSGAGPRYVVAAGCEIARSTPPQNVDTLRRFALEH